MHENRPADRRPFWKQHSCHRSIHFCHGGDLLLAPVPDHNRRCTLGCTAGDIFEPAGAADRARPTLRFLGARLLNQVFRVLGVASRVRVRDHDAGVLDERCVQ